MEKNEENELLISYTKSLYYSCRDLDKHDDDQMVVRFEI